MVGHLSYVATGEGWLYLAANTDVATREIGGWGMAGSLRADLAYDPLSLKPVIAP